MSQCADYINAPLHSHTESDDNFNHDELKNINNLVICSSTYGQGDVPDGSQSFYDFLSNSKTNLSHIRYGVFALGDMTYAETFCFGGKKFDSALGLTIQWPEIPFVS